MRVIVTIPTRNSHRAVHSAGVNLDVRAFWGSPFSASLIITEAASAKQGELVIGSSLCEEGIVFEAFWQPKKGVAEVYCV